MIRLTSSAVDAVKTAMARASEVPGGLRIQVETGGCAGYKYMMGLVQAPQAEDEIVTFEDVSVYIDAASQPLLAGTTIDFVVALEGSGFTFENPNAEQSCSCGKSFG